MQRRDPSALYFSEQLRSLRLSAMIIYDRGKALGQSAEELGAAVKPLMETLDKIVEAGVANDLAGVCEAVKQLEAEAKMYEHDIERIHEKRATTLSHHHRLTTAIAGHLRGKGVSEAMDRGYSATLVELDGVVRTIIR